ncbi:hypothetical protein WDU94_008760 [Cyamophila willieti]
MPYILVKGNLAPYVDNPFWKVSVSGLKSEDITQLERFSCDISNQVTVLYYKHPCVILTALEVLGYQVVASTTAGQNEFLWTMRKEFPEPEPDDDTLEAPKLNNHH